MKVLKLLILLFSLHTTTAFSQGFNFININTDIGLPSNECYRIAQDERGYVWISTESGLVKYNSKEFVLFNTAKGMPSNNDIYALDVDEHGRVWFATGGWRVGYILNDTVNVLPELNFYNEKTKNGDIIYKIKYNNATNSLFVSSHHQSIEIIKDNNNYISKEIKSINQVNGYALVGESYVANLFKTGFLEIISKTNNSIPLYLKDSSFLSMHFKNPFFSEIFSMPSNNDLVFISVMNQIILMDKKRGAILQRTDLLTQVQSLFVDSHRNLWVGYKKDGIYFFRGGNLLKKPLHLLTELSVSNIIEDHENGIWATTLEKGVFFCSNISITSISKFSGTGNGINFSKVVNGKLWLSSDAIPLAIIDKDTIYLDNIGNEKHPRITDIAHVSNGYYLSTSLGLYFLDNKIKSITPIYSIIPIKLLSGFRGIASNSTDTCYVYDNINFNRLEHRKVTGIESENVKIKHAYLSNTNEIVFCSKQGLHKLIMSRLNGGKVINVASGLFLHDLNKLYCDNQGNFWLLANSDTLYVLDKDFNLKIVIPLIEKNIGSKSVLQINATTFFVATNKGLLQISFTDNSFKEYTLRYFDKGNGLPSSDVYNLVQFKKVFYVSTSNGLCYFDRPEDLQYSIPPNTIINSFKVNDNSVSLSGNPSFSYKQNNISFQVDALAFKRILQRGAFYKYRLEGLEKEFRIATGNITSYNNLPPGHYKFIAKTFYDSSIEDTTPAEFSFVIKPAFWQTWWGMLLMVSVGIAAIFMFIQFRIRKIKGAEKEKAAINQTIAEYRFTALKAQMDPHFVFNSINVIQNLILEKDKTEAYNSLGKFSRLIRMILNQSDSVFATIEEELALINLYVELNQLRIDYSFTFSSQIEPQLMSCNIPSLIIQPFIENALWHGILPLKGAKEGKISLRILMEANDVLVIQVEDNGIGRKASSSNKSSIHISKGINLIRERLKAYQSMNNDCLAELNIVDLEENDGAGGTLVEIKIAIPNDEA